ncbi:hypothetical protein EQV77_14785 [Halobacillus fulvus]|nr:hypothetical protein EQV77_14785 [Halobacillus fulvus]
MKKLMGIFITCIVITLAGCDSKGHEGEAKTPSGSSAQKGRDYQEVVSDFKDKGFKNIETEKMEDLITGWLTKDGEVESVSVDGDQDYSPDDWYSNDVKVVITYHTFPSEDEKSEPASSSEQEPKKEDTDKAEKVELEDIFPVEDAKRSAVVAITNAYATDVFKKDGNTYDVSKLHSYADTSGNVDQYFMRVNSWGSWSAKDKETWHVDSLILENSFGALANATLDVHFDGTHYVVSNINGTFGNPGASTEFLSDLSDIAFGSPVPVYLTISPELIKEDRSEAEVEELDHSDELDKYVARTAFNKHGKSLYPYGFKSHWILDLRNEEQTSNGSWRFKVGVTITNQYGEKMEAVAEGLISGTTDNPTIEEFYVN